MRRGDNDHPPAGRGLRGNKPVGTLLLDFHPPEPSEDKLLVSKLPVCGVSPGTRASTLSPPPQMGSNPQAGCGRQAPSLPTPLPLWGISTPSQLWGGGMREKGAQRVGKPRESHSQTVGKEDTVSACAHGWTE